MAPARGTTEIKGNLGSELRKVFSRTEQDVLLVDDTLRNVDSGREETVQCFLCSRRNREEPRRYDDSVVTGSHPPEFDRIVELKEAERMQTIPSGVRPIPRLDPSRVSRPGDEVHGLLSSALSERYVDVWKRDRRVPVAATDMLEMVARDGYDVMLTGGLVRDSIRPPSASASAVARGDIDLVGSVPPGTFCERIREVVGRAEVPKRFNPRSGVVAVWTDGDRSERFLEYAALRESDLTADGQFRFGCDLEADSHWRDLTVNTLTYDWRTGYLVDPTGRGLDDLRALRLVSPTLPKKKPGFLTEKLFRYLKFLDRWPEADISALSTFVSNRFGEISKDMEMTGGEQLERLAEPLGEDASKRRARALSLLGKLAPGEDWSELLDATWKGSP